MQSLRTEPTEIEEIKPQANSWLRLLILASLMLLAALMNGCADEDAVSASEVVAPEQPTVVMTIADVTPTPGESSGPTELPLTEEAAPPIVTVVLATREPTPEPTLPPQLPTLTPTSPPPPAAERTIEISGSTLMRLSLSGEGFDSTGKPHNTRFEPRQLSIGGDSNVASVEWCLQLGLVNETYSLDMQIDPYTDDLTVTGTITLQEGFCGADGEIMDSADVDLGIPVGAAAQISYNLQGKRSLFGVSGLLDSDTGAIVELRITNSNPK